jgi:hypothetical protein
MEAARGIERQKGDALFSTGDSEIPITDRRTGLRLGDSGQGAREDASRQKPRAQAPAARG